jgi:ABC-type tungstate transport system permease subunit
MDGNKKYKMSTTVEFSETLLIGTVRTTAETADQIEVQWVPRGTFAGTRFDLALVENGGPVACDTGDQGGGQN